MTSRSADTSPKAKGEHLVNIKEKRLQVKLTQHDLAAKLGIDRSTVAKWESGAAYPRAEQWPVLANLLQCTVDDLYSKEE